MAHKPIEHFDSVIIHKRIWGFFGPGREFVKIFDFLLWNALSSGTSTFEFIDISCFQTEFQSHFNELFYIVLENVHVKIDDVVAEVVSHLDTQVLRLLNLDGITLNV